MIHQHFKLVDVFTAVENIALSMDKGEKFDLRRVRTKPVLFAKNTSLRWIWTRRFTR